MILRGLVPALVLNLAILIAPSALLGRFDCDDPLVWAFLAIVSALVLADAPTIGRPLSIARDERDRRTIRLAALTGGLILLVFWIALLERATTARTTIGAWNYLGGGLMVAGVVLRGAAVRSLGDRFITEPGDGPLVERGLHGWVRHPSETGNLLASFGAALLLGSLIGLAITSLLLVPLVLVRVRLEERELRERFGSRFDQYANRVGALWPRLAPRSRGEACAPGATGGTADLEAGSGGSGPCESAGRGAG